MSAEEELTSERGRAPRWWRGRVQQFVAVAVAGALVGAAAMAWQQQAGPFADEGEGRLCWGALGPADLAPLLREPEGIESADVPVLSDDTGYDGPTGSCHLTGRDGMDGGGWAMTVRVHRLDNRFGSGGRWADEFLAGRLTPLGGDLSGMASDGRAWLALPEGCPGPAVGDKTQGPTVVDIADSLTPDEDQPDRRRRDALARMLVKVTNKVTADLGCSGRIADPVPHLAANPRYDSHERPDALCGIKGLALPGNRKPESYPIRTSGTWPVRTCDRDPLLGSPSMRLMTVEDPRLVEMFYGPEYVGAPVESGSRAGYGGIGPNQAWFRAKCESGRVLFLVRSNGSGHRAGDVRALFPKYAEAEADRLGCGPLRLKLP
ncbi:hypothetical protein G5C51_36725 [Streptomyces sp. A7024]|uniref:Uncharacterized protein n=1 Tax=Streptomyces coryli TaxID=1128680 RepID=A0A6G4UCH8_9ACTN|nr:hypothetical protein [Streptomyces coryli]NGN69420.1 hypothetical protein [Streptomyces coryli]